MVAVGVEGEVEVRVELGVEVGRGRVSDPCSL
mgnify:CR=1 FL=1|jgi:hypothetical protein